MLARVLSQTKELPLCAAEEGRVRPLWQVLSYLFVSINISPFYVVVHEVKV